MSQIISPYALLQASKPAPKIVTTYDLYSAVQSASPASFPAAPPSPQAQDASNPRRQEPPVQEAQQTAARMPLVPAKRTHYIADIKNRHNAALRRTLPNQRPPMA
ncbi:MAG: hypothetical protein Q4G52_06680 [Clostridia bacterium]|nr:hypothetical protein [Clostridia bacterium]